MEVENSTESEPFTIDYNTRWQVIGYYECCLNQQQTADHFGIHQSSVSRILSKFQVSGSVSNYQKSGRNQILGSNEECEIEEIVKKNRYSTAQEIADNLNVSKNTVLSKMHELGLKFSIPKEIPQLNASHIEKRLRHCTQLKDTNIQSIIFTDESYFQLYRNTIGRWHFETEENYLCKPQTKVCLMVYGCISWSGKSRIYIYKKGFKVNSEVYCDVMKEILFPFAEREFKQKTRRKSAGEWYLLQDNAPSHRSKHTQSFLKENNIATLQHPPNSPDLNPIELVWSILKRLVEKSQPKNEESLSSCIVSCWDSIPQSQIQSCIEHFQRRVDQVFSLNGSFY
ncbi:hypothetical protein ABPG72_019823 [Tetrahymena utriculariae]